MKNKFIAVLDNPESTDFQYVEELMNAGYAVDYLTNEGSYRLNASDKTYDGMAILSLEESSSFPDSWSSKLGIIKEAAEKKIPVIVLSEKPGETEIKARNLGAVVLKKPVSSKDLICKLKNLGI